MAQVWDAEVCGKRTMHALDTFFALDPCPQPFRKGVLVLGARSTGNNWSLLLAQSRVRPTKDPRKMLKLVCRSAGGTSPLEFNVESLESRRMLAGNIRVSVNNAGDVLIRGDGRSNDVEVSQNENGDIVIAGTEVLRAAVWS